MIDVSAHLSGVVSPVKAVYDEYIYKFGRLMRRGLCHRNACSLLYISDRDMDLFQGQNTRHSRAVFS